MRRQGDFWRRFGTTVLAVIVSVVLLAVLFTGGVALYSRLTRPGVPSRTILELDLERGLAEYVMDDPIARASAGGALSVRDVVDALERAKGDRRVVGLVARLGTGPISLGHVQEVRDAVLSFRESGKPAVAFSETFGELAPGLGHYYLATAFDGVYLQPSGDLGLIGLVSENPFLGNLFERLDVSVQMDHRYEYKTALNTLTEEEFTEAHREAVAQVAESLHDQIVRAVSEARGIEETEMRELIAEGPYLAGEALALDLVDGLAYRDEVYEDLRAQAGGNARFLFLERYLARAGRPHRRGETIALIYGVGNVMRGPSGFDPFDLVSTMGSETVTRAFREAIEDRRVRAIIFRIDSPGGSYVASDAIRREVARAQQAGKPVIASMSGVAASGGYFVAMPAEKILAQPATITGSIGVVGGKVVVRELSERIGVTWDLYRTTENATMWSELEEFTPRQWARVQAWLDRVYEDFTARAAEARGMTQAELQEHARGRIWTGEDALALGLVDELGGFGRALELAGEAAGIDPERGLRLQVFPRPRSLLGALLGRGRESSQPAAAELYARMMQRFQPLLRTLRALGWDGTEARSGRTLRMEEMKLSY